MHDPTDELVAGIRAGDRRALARAITLAESTRADHHEQAQAVLAALLPDTGRAIRVGISGPPGVGKSTFIESFGLYLLDEGIRLAVLAIDPSSTVSGGSILGDKTRMTELNRRVDAFIRPTPSGGSLGGVARRTREALLLCEAFGFDVIVIETVGVGQSETAVADLVDLFLLLVAPGGGDDLQGIKRGIMELADVVVVNKADGDLAPAAGRTAADYRNALHLLRPRSPAWSPEVLLASGLTGTGIAEIWEAVGRHRRAFSEAGELDRLRSGQAVAWLWSEVRETLEDRFRANDAVRALLPAVESDVRAGRTTPAAGAARLLSALGLG